MTFLLKPAELLYRGINRLRRNLYRRKILEARALPRPVISVGNTAIGGSGKTPAVIAIAQLLASNGRKVAVLTRGYGRRDPRGSGLVTDHDANRFGDEPVLIARRVPEADVVVGSNRIRSAEEYLREHDCDVFLLDDGFQHLQLARDVDVVLDNPAARWYREGPDALSNADIVVRRDAAAEYVAATVSETFVWRGDRRPVRELRELRVVAFAGLADNAQFFDAIEKLGAVVVLRAEFGDHHCYTTADVDWLSAELRASHGDMLVTTEKDWVKIQQPEIAYVELEMRFSDAFTAKLLGLLNSEFKPFGPEPPRR